jgi:hypothetical protein
MNGGNCTLQEFMSLVPVNICVESKDGSRVHLRRGYETRVGLRIGTVLTKWARRLTGDRIQGDLRVRSNRLHVLKILGGGGLTVTPIVLLP